MPETLGTEGGKLEVAGDESCLTKGRCNRDQLRICLSRSFLFAVRKVGEREREIGTTVD